MKDKGAEMAKEEKDEKIVEEGLQPPKKKPLVKWIIIGLSVLILAAGGTVGAMYFTKKNGSKQASAGQSAETALWAMEPFIVNLVDNQGDRYLKVVIELEVSDKNRLVELNKIKPKLRDNVLDLLTAKSYRELVDIAGKQRLKDEIGIRLNNFLTTGKIVKVYFTEFVVQ